MSKLKIFLIFLLSQIIVISFLITCVRSNTKETAQAKKKEYNLIPAPFFSPDRPLVPDTLYRKRATWAETMIETRKAVLQWIVQVEEKYQTHAFEVFQNPLDKIIDTLQKDFPEVSILLSWDFKKLEEVDISAMQGWFRSKDGYGRETNLINKQLSYYQKELGADSLFIEKLKEKWCMYSNERNDEGAIARLIVYQNLSKYRPYIYKINDAAVKHTATLWKELKQSSIEQLPDQSEIKEHDEKLASFAQQDKDLIDELKSTMLEATYPPMEQYVAFQLATETVRERIGQLTLLKKGISSIVLVQRTYTPGWHWYENLGYRGGNPDEKLYGTEGKMMMLDLKTGKIKTILDDKKGSVRDPFVDYHAEKILFSYRPGETEFYHLYECDLNGKKMKQLTDGPFNDIEPTYIPDGDIVFSSTRCKRYVPCLSVHVVNLFRCKADGKDIIQLSANVEEENTPWVLPDGRIMFTRWEYVDRNRLVYHHLWTMNPDGTAQMVLYGNMHKHHMAVMIDAKPIPNSNKLISIFSGSHGKHEHEGCLVLVDPDEGPDARKRETHLTPYGLHVDEIYRDPYPVSESLFIVAKKKELMLMDDKGNEMAFFRLKNDHSLIMVHEPRAVIARKREPIIPKRINMKKENGTMFLADVYHGRRMEGGKGMPSSKLKNPYDQQTYYKPGDPELKRGDIKKLMLLEVLPKPVQHEGHTEPLSWNGTFFVERILGIVDVEEDGSAYFEVPAMRPIFFVALDENNEAVKRMQSFVSVMPGEMASCVGCHENRGDVSRVNKPMLAYQKPAQKIKPIDVIPEISDFRRDIQPLINKHCLQCHNQTDRKGNLSLTDDLDPWFNEAYTMLTTHKQYTFGNDFYGNRAPREIGSGNSPVIEKFKGGHHGVQATKDELNRVRHWVDAGAMYSGTYASLNTTPGDRTPIDMYTIEKNCMKCHDEKFWKWTYYTPGIFPNEEEKYGIRTNYTNISKSLFLTAHLSKQKGGLEIGGVVLFSDTTHNVYQRMKKDITKWVVDWKPYRVELNKVPNANYVFEMKRYGTLPENYNPEKDTLTTFEIDQKYFRQFQYKPVTEDKNNAK